MVLHNPTIDKRSRSMSVSEPMHRRATINSPNIISNSIKVVIPRGERTQSNASHDSVVERPTPNMNSLEPVGEDTFNADADESASDIHFETKTEKATHIL